MKLWEKNGKNMKKCVLKPIDGKNCEILEKINKNHRIECVCQDWLSILFQRIYIEVI